MKRVLLCSLISLSLFGENVDELLDGFDNTPATKSDTNDTSQEDELLAGFDDKAPQKETIPHKNRLHKLGIEGRFTQSLAYSYHNDKPHDKLSSLKSLLFLEYNKKLNDNFKLKINGNTFYDATYAIKRKSKFTSQEIDSLESEVELFDAYIEGSLRENLDIKAGRQVVVWGKSDTIRVTDVLNPLDNRRPAMVDIEDLRLPTTMLKLDYYKKDWKISPIIIVEQRFNKNPPFGGDFYPSPKKLPTRSTPHTPSYALEIAGEFSGYDINFYLADIYAQDELGLPLVSHNKKVKMAGFATNFVHESWLFKTELAYKKDFQFLQTGDKSFDRIDTLVGFEYNGIKDTKLSYDFANKHITDKNPHFRQNSYQHAFRITSDFKNATLHTNYLIALFGEKANKGGFQRAWIKYDIADALSTNIGIVDYIGGNKLFDAINDNDMIFADVSYSF